MEGLRQKVQSEAVATIGKGGRGWQGSWNLQDRGIRATGRGERLRGAEGAQVRMSPGVWLGSWVDARSRRWGGKDCGSQSGSAVGNVTSELSPQSGLREAQTGGVVEAESCFWMVLWVEFHRLVTDR